MGEDSNLNQGDPYFLEENTLVDNYEVSNEDLLREIKEEEAKEEALREAALAEGNVRGETLEAGSQLTEFQENIITTGSGVGKALLVMLVLSFIIKSMEITWNWMKRKAALSQVKRAISKTHGRSVDEYDPSNPNFKRMEYVEYNAEFKTAELMDEKIRQGNVGKRYLLDMLQQRMYECLHRRIMLEKNDHSVTKAYQMNMLPLQIWNDFVAAKESLQAEMIKIKMLTLKLGVSFKDLLESAQAKYWAKGKQSSWSNGQRRLKPEKKKGKEKIRRLSNRSSRSPSPMPRVNIVDAKSMSPADRAAAKGLRRRRKY